MGKSTRRTCSASKCLGDPKATEVGLGIERLKLPVFEHLSSANVFELRLSRLQGLLNRWKNLVSRYPSHFEAQALVFDHLGDNLVEFPSVRGAGIGGDLDAMFGNVRQCGPQGFEERWLISVSFPVSRLGRTARGHVGFGHPVSNDDVNRILVIVGRQGAHGVAPVCC